MGNNKKKLKQHEFKNVDELKTLVKSIYDEFPISAIQNWEDSVRDSFKSVLAIDWKHLNCLIIKISFFNASLFYNLLILFPLIYLLFI